MISEAGATRSAVWFRPLFGLEGVRPSTARPPSVLWGLSIGTMGGKVTDSRVARRTGWLRAEMAGLGQWQVDGAGMILPIRWGPVERGPAVPVGERASPRLARSLFRPIPQKMAEWISRPNQGKEPPLSPP